MMKYIKPYRVTFLNDYAVLNIYIYIYEFWIFCSQKYGLLALNINSSLSVRWKVELYYSFDDFVSLMTENHFEHLCISLFNS